MSDPNGVFLWSNELWCTLSIMYNEFVLSNSYSFEAQHYLGDYYIHISYLPWYISRNCSFRSYWNVVSLIGFANDIFHYWNYWRHFISHLNAIQYLQTSALRHGRRARKCIEMVAFPPPPLTRTMCSRLNSPMTPVLPTLSWKCDTNILKYAFLQILLWKILAQSVKIYIMMTSTSGNIFRVTSHLCGEFTHRPVTRSFDVFFALRLN